MPRIVPIIEAGNLPETQQAAGRAIDYALAGLDYYASNFKSALDLFDYCNLQLKKPSSKANKNWRDWQFIAARDGALSIYHLAGQ